MSLKKLIKNIFVQRGAILFVSLLTLVVIANQLHFRYPDEFENILGGKFILNGIFPYSGFFTHHNPLAYYIAAPLVFLASGSFVKFRLLWGVVQILSALGFYLLLKKRFSNELVSKAFLLIVVFLSLLATFNWGHMLLADSLGSLLMLGSYLWLFWIVMRGHSLQRNDLILISTLTSLSLFTTMTQVFTAGTIYLFLGFIYFLQKPKLKLINSLIILLFPYLVFAVVLLLTGSLNDFYTQAIRYNADIYAHLPDGATFRNPLRVLIVFIVKFWNSFKVALGMVKDFNLGNPFVSSMALANAGFVLYLLINKRFALSTFVVATLIFANARGDPYTTQETDYQALLYHLLSISNGSFLILGLWNDLKDNMETAKKVVFSSLLILHGIYFIFLFLFLFDKWQTKTYEKYMGRDPLIYDRPSVAAEVSSLIESNDTYYIGPFDFENQLYMRNRLATRYIVALPGMYQSPTIQEETLFDLKQNKPPLVVFDTNMAVYGVVPGKYILDYLGESYVTVEQINVACDKYEAITPKYDNYEIDKHFFILKERSQELLDRMVEKNILRVKNASCPA